MLEPTDNQSDNLSHWIRIDHLASNFLKNGTKIENPFGGKGIYKIGINPGLSQNQQKPNTTRRSCSDSYQCRVLDCQWPEYPLEWYRQCINMNEIRHIGTHFKRPQKKYRVTAPLKLVELGPKQILNWKSFVFNPAKRAFLRRF